MNPPNSFGVSRRLLRLCVPALALLLVTAACGSSSSEPADSASDLDPSEEPTAAVSPSPVPTDGPADEPTAAPEPTAVTEPEEAEETAMTDTGETESSDDAAASPRSGETIVWGDCDQIECALVPMPVDYGDPSLGTIDIAISVHRATGVDEEWIGYLLVNPGGPGGSGIEFAQAAADGAFTENVLDRFDIIGFDPRGVGFSEPTFSCGDGTEFVTLTSQIVDEVDTDEEIAIGEQVGALCSDAMGPAGNRLHTANVARDMDEIRARLGVDQVSYYGGSYGSAVGVWYATLFPNSVRAMVVDGASNPVNDQGDSVEEQVQATIEQAGGFETQLAVALDACADESCPIFNGGDPAGYLELAAAKADLVRDASPSGSSSALLMGVITPLYTEAAWPQLYNALFELVENDNGEPLATIAVEQLGEVAGTNITGQVNCLDQWLLRPDQTVFEPVDVAEQAEIEARLFEELPLIAQFVADEFEPCPFLGDLAPEPLDIPFDGANVPILVIGNTSDPATPYVQSEELAQDVLSNGYLLRVDHANHVVYVGGFNECVNGHVETMLIEQTPPSDRVVECAREEGAVPTVDDVPEFMELVCAEVATGMNPAADGDTVAAACSDIAAESIDEFGAEALLAILNGSDTDQDNIDELVDFVQTSLVEAGIG